MDCWNTMWILVFNKTNLGKFRFGILSVPDLGQEWFILAQGTYSQLNGFDN